MSEPPPSTTTITSSSSSKSTSTCFPLWEFPDVILCHIVSFVAAPTHRAHVLCHQLAVLNRQAYSTILLQQQERFYLPRAAGIWELILHQDYGVELLDEYCHYDDDDESPQTANPKKRRRRTCGRLRRSPVHRVRDAHRLIQERTEIAYFYLTEMCETSACKNKKKNDNLSKSKLCKLIQDYGPYLRFNTVTSTGGVFLVEVCRARHVTEAVILKCVQYLVQECHANVNVCTNESKNSSTGLTAVMVAAVRAMPAVLQYLLSQRGVNVQLRGTGRFRLHTVSTKTFQCVNATAFEFASGMLQAEQAAGAPTNSLRDLKKCIALLSSKQQQQQDDSIVTK